MIKEKTGIDKNEMGLNIKGEPKLVDQPAKQRFTAFELKEGVFDFGPCSSKTIVLLDVKVTFIIFYFKEVNGTLRNQ